MQVHGGQKALFNKRKAIFQEFWKSGIQYIKGFSCKKLAG